MGAHHGVLERGASHDVSGKDVLLEEIAHDLAHGVTFIQLFLVFRRERRRTRDGHPERLSGARHRVGRVHLRDRGSLTRGAN